MEEKFLIVENIYNILLQIFDVKFSKVRIVTQRTLLRTIYMGTTKFSENKEVLYRTLSVHFFLSVLYSMIKEEDKETFYRNVYNDFENINEEYVSLIVDEINTHLGVELFKKSLRKYG